MAYELTPKELRMRLSDMADHLRDADTIAGNIVASRTLGPERELAIRVRDALASFYLQAERILDRDAA